MGSELDLDDCAAVSPKAIANLAELRAENHELKLALQNYMDACNYADKDTLISAIGAAHKRALELVPRRIYPCPHKIHPRLNH